MPAIMSAPIVYAVMTATVAMPSRRAMILLSRKFGLIVHLSCLMLIEFGIRMQDTFRSTDTIVAG